MMSQQAVQCQIRQATVNVTFMQLRQGRGAKAAVERRPLACDHSASCPKSAFCRFVNPLTTRLPFDANAPVATPIPDSNNRAS